MRVRQRRWACVTSRQLWGCCLGEQYRPGAAVARLVLATRRHSRLHPHHCRPRRRRPRQRRRRPLLSSCLPLPCRRLPRLRSGLLSSGRLLAHRGHPGGRITDVGHLAKRKSAPSTPVHLHTLRSGNGARVERHGLGLGVERGLERHRNPSGNIRCGGGAHFLTQPMLSSET